jgi:hypothetical protein
MVLFPIKLLAAQQIHVKEVRRLAILQMLAIVSSALSPVHIFLRGYIGTFCYLIADALQRELGLGFGDPHSWQLGPDRRKERGHSGYLRWFSPILFLWSSNVITHMEGLCLP